MFEGILGRDDEKWTLEWHRLISDRDLMFLHCFEESGLDLRRSTIDLISEEDMSEYWTLSFREGSLFLIIDLGSDEIHREEVRGE